MRRIEQIIRDLFALNYQLVWIRQFHFSAGGAPQIPIPMPRKRLRLTRLAS
jgi:hypothetical protein